MVYIYRTNLIMIMILHYYFKLISDIQYHSQKDKIEISLWHSFLYGKWFPKNKSSDNNNKYICECHFH
jgi:hypothetical protein